MSRASLFAIAVLFLYGSPALALTRVAPPGNSGASQYQEDVPSAGGAIPVTKLPSGVGVQSVLPRRVVTQLDHAGAAGRAAAQLANRTAPPALGEVHRSPSGGRGGARGEARSGITSVPPTSSIGSQLAKAVIGGSGGGLGVLLPVVLAGFLTAAIATLLARRRRTQ